MNSSKLKNKKKEGTNIKEKFTYEQPGYINVAGEVFFLDLNDDSSNLTKLLFDPSVKGMNAFRGLFLEGKTPPFSEDEKKRLITIFRTVFGINSSKQTNLPCIQTDKDLLINSLLLRRFKLIQQMNAWNEYVSSGDIHVRTLRDQLFALNDLIFDKLPNSTYPCKDIDEISSRASGKPRFSLDDKRMKDLLSIFAYLLAQGKDPLDLFIKKNPNPIDLFPKLAPKGAPKLADYETEYKLKHEGKDPIYTETLQQIKYIIDNKGILPKTATEENFIKLLEEIEKAIPDTSLTGSTPLTGNVNDRKDRIIKKIKDLLNDLGKKINKLRECESKLEYAEKLQECVVKTLPYMENLEKLVKEIEDILPGNALSKIAIENILKENNTLKQEIEKLKKITSASPATSTTSTSTLVPTIPQLPVNTELEDILNEIDEEMKKLSQDIQHNISGIPNLTEQIKSIFQLVRNLINELNDRENTIRQLDQEKNDLINEGNAIIQRLQNDLAQALTDLNNLQVENANLLQDNSNLYTDNSTLQNENQTLEQNNRQLTADIQTLEQDNQNLTTDNTNLTNQRNQLDIQNAQLDAQLKTLTSQIQALQADNQRLQSQLSNFPPSTSGADQQRIQTLQNENQQYQNQINANNTLIANLQSTVAGLQAQIRQLQQDLFDAEFQRDDAENKRQIAEDNFLTSMGLQQQAQNDLATIQAELDAKNKILEDIRNLMVRKSAQLPNPIMRQDNEDDLSLYDRILNQLVPDTRNDIYDEIIRVLMIQTDPNWSLQQKKDNVLQTIRKFIQQKTAISRLFETLNQRFNIPRDPNDTDIQFYEKILKAMPQEDCGPFLDQIKIRLTDTGFQDNMTNQEKLDDLLRTIDNKRKEITDLTNRFITLVNDLLRRLGLRGNLQAGTSTVMTNSLIETINQKIDTYKAFDDANRHALCLLYFFWNLIKNVFREYESTFQKVAALNLNVSDSVLEILQKCVAILQQEGVPTQNNPLRYPDPERLARLYPSLQSLVASAISANGFTEEDRSVAAFILSYFFPNLPNSNAVNLEANGNIVFQPENNSPTRIDMGLLFLLLLTYTQKFLSSHADILQEAGCEVGIQLRPASQQPVQVPASPSGPQPPSGNEDNSNDDEEEEEKKKQNDIVPSPVPLPRPSLPVQQIWRPLTTTCPYSKTKVLEYNPNMKGDSSHFLTVAQEAILEKYPFCLNVDVLRKGSGEKIAYSLNDLNKKMTQAVRTAFGNNPPLEPISKYGNIQSGVLIALDKDGKVYAQVSPAAAGGGTRKRNRKAKNSAKTKKLHK